MRGMQSILAKFMKDSVVRGCLLQLLYERRSEGSIPFGHAEQAVPPPGGISRRDWLRAVAQLSEYRLIDWTPLEDQSGMGLLSGFAKINDFGIKVLEAGAAPPIRISIDESRRTAVSRQQQAPSATSTPQQQVIREALEKLITAINQADVSEREKNEAKSLLRKLLGSKAAARVLGAGGGFPAAETFAGEGRMGHVLFLSRAWTRAHRFDRTMSMRKRRAVPRGAPRKIHTLGTRHLAQSTREVGASGRCESVREARYTYEPCETRPPRC